MNEVKQPSWINNKNNKIIILGHETTFKDKKHLPNTNSNAIETTIINIPNLSEHYIYFCDDIFLGKPTEYTDFFTSDGKAIVSKLCMIDNTTLKLDHVNILNIKFPPNVNHFYHHVPLPQIKSVIKDFFNTYPDYIEWIRSTKKRNDNGTSICNLNFLNSPCQQIHYPIFKYMYSKDKAVLTTFGSPSKNIFISNNNLYKYHNKICALDILLIIKPMFYCINDDEKNPQKRIEIRDKMQSFFNKYYPNKASFEI
jgi:hypothetical protein